MGKKINTRHDAVCCCKISHRLKLSWTDRQIDRIHAFAVQINLCDTKGQLSLRVASQHTDRQTHTRSSLADFSKRVFNQLDSWVGHKPSVRNPAIWPAWAVLHELSTVWSGGNPLPETQFCAFRAWKSYLTVTSCYFCARHRTRQLCYGLDQQTIGMYYEVNDIMRREQKKSK